MVLGRRVDTVAVIGRALTAAARRGGASQGGRAGGASGLDGAGLAAPVPGGGRPGGGAFHGLGVSPGPEPGADQSDRLAVADAVEAIGVARPGGVVAVGAAPAVVVGVGADASGCCFPTRTHPGRRLIGRDPLARSCRSMVGPAREGGTVQRGIEPPRWPCSVTP